MIYNENGIIINEEYNLLEYINHTYYLDDVLNESEFTDKVKQGAKELIDKLILAAEGIVKWVKEFPSREIIKKNKDKIKSILKSCLAEKNLDDTHKTFVVIQNDIAPYVLSKGYGFWYQSFILAVDYLKNLDKCDDDQKIISNILNILYSGNPSENEEEWFYTNKNKGITSKLKSEDIIDCAINISNYTGMLSDLYKKLKKTFKDNPNKFSIKILQVMYSYYIRAIRAFRNLSTACVKICVNISKTGESGFKYTGYYTDSSKSYKRKINEPLNQNDINSSNNKNDQSQDPDKELKTIEKKFNNMSNEEIDKLVYNENKIDDTIKNYADNHEIEHLRYIFLDSLDVDPTFVVYEKSFDYCINKIPEMFDQHEDVVYINNKPFTIINNPSKWNDNYWIQLKKSLKKNYSIKRFNHMKNVAKIIYKDKIIRLHAERRENLKNKYIKESYKK